MLRAALGWAAPRVAGIGLGLDAASQLLTSGGAALGTALTRRTTATIAALNGSSDPADVIIVGAGVSAV
jgi:hypothetical protein